MFRIYGEALVARQNLWHQANFHYILAVSDPVGLLQRFNFLLMKKLIFQYRCHFLYKAEMLYGMCYCMLTYQILSQAFLPNPILSYTIYEQENINQAWLLPQPIKQAFLFHSLLHYPAYILNIKSETTDLWEIVGRGLVAIKWGLHIHCICPLKGPYVCSLSVGLSVTSRVHKDIFWSVRNGHSTDVTIGADCVAAACIWEIFDLQDFIYELLGLIYLA